ncbi:MAG: hypothetical protein KatS3mg079_680 [Caloramator sp.]|nr:MAG: hypothetical protein KatS3mg079_680 [Caloramator sp.]
MDFEEALRYELNSIDEIKNKIYPLYAPQDVISPFLVYKKTMLKYLMTIDGKLNGTEAQYGLILITKTYSEAQNISKKIMDAVFDMFARNVGDNGPYIQAIEITNLGDEYEYETECFRTNFKIEVKY